MAHDSRDPYAPTKFQESNAILLAGMVDGDDDPNASARLDELLRDMTPNELARLAGAASELRYRVGLLLTAACAQRARDRMEDRDV